VSFYLHTFHRCPSVTTGGIWTTFRMQLRAPLEAT
jgi:hypothetical protein